MWALDGNGYPNPNFNLTLTGLTLTLILILTHHRSIVVLQRWQRWRQCSRLGSSPSPHPTRKLGPGACPLRCRGLFG